MEDNEIEKVLKKLVGEGYKLKAQHNNKDWREALENAERVLIKMKNNK